MTIAAIYARSDDVDAETLNSICAQASEQIIQLLAAVKPDTKSIVTVFLHEKPSYDLSVTVKAQGTVEEIEKKLSR